MLLESVLIFFNLLAVLSYLKFANSQKQRYAAGGTPFLVNGREESGWLVDLKGSDAFSFGGAAWGLCVFRLQDWPLALDFTNTFSFLCN